MSDFTCERCGQKNEQRDYLDDVRGTARGFVDDCTSGNYEGDIHDALHELIDGSQRVIYTWQAKMCVIWSDNDDAYFTEFGGEGASDGDGINWSRLAYAAFMADVTEEIDRILDSDLGRSLHEFDSCEDIASAYVPRVECSECLEEYKADSIDGTSIADHNRCVSCQKDWQTAEGGEE